MKGEILSLDTAKRISELEKRIDKAVEYIENNQEEHKFTDRGGFTYTDGYFLRDTEDVLKILKGSDNYETNTM